jgi:hypothetical protein
MTMDITNIHVFGFMPALHAMRNPMESWGKSDSKFYIDSPYPNSEDVPWDPSMFVPEWPLIGPDDLALALKLIKAGPAHRKFMRQIIVWWDIKIPRDVWQELDTYKVATVRNSCSTMHKLGSRDLELSDFQDEDVDLDVLEEINEMGDCYRNKKPFFDSRARSSTRGQTFEGVKLLHHLKGRLPEHFLQMATYTFSYETALNMYYDREKHRMPEWSGEDGICVHLRSLPYMDQFIAAAAGQRG